LNSESPVETDAEIVQNSATVDDEHERPVIPTIIHATADIEDSPNGNLIDEELDSLLRFITSRDHLKQNNNNIEFEHVSTREFRTKFKHLVGVKINVKTVNLWEAARSYIWKHIGNDTWTRGNETKITLARIHQK
jgi:hypothetical protein